jgi:hypothetical protein
VSAPLPVPLGYAGLVPFDRAQHGGRAVREAGRMAFAARLHAAPLAVVEFQHAARHYPIAFVRDPASGRPQPIAVLGLERERNLFVRDGAWEPLCWIPAFVRRWPFYTVQVTRPAQAGARDDAVICVDESGLTEDAAAGSALFAAGEPTAAWRPIEQLVREVESARVQTDAFSARLVELGLLEGFEAHAVPSGGGPPRTIGGLERVAEERLNALPDAAVRELMQRGFLSRIYAHLTSLDNFRYLLERAVPR